MISFIRSLFRASFTSVTPGSTYILDRTPVNPFEENNPCLVEVLEVKEHWVRYRMLPIDSSLFQNEKMHIVAFKLVFRKVKEADWIGKLECRFHWRHLKYNYGRWHFTTNCCGETTDKWWVWEDESRKN
jgi:hypothetical protein